MQATISKTQRDPVCGMEVDPANAAGQVAVHGKVFYFCSEHCRHLFEEAPEAYGSGADGTGKVSVDHGGAAAASGGHACCGHQEAKTPAASAPAKRGRYFCPMCPGVNADEPGACPKCGMALERNPLWKPAKKAAATFTCPMHSEVRQSSPGACPVCGMALERADGAGDEDEDPELRDLTRRLWIGGALTLPVFLLAMGHLFPSAPHWLMGPISRWTQFALATPVALWAGWPFLARGWRSLVTRQLNMFTLIALGVSAAYFYSAAAMLAPGAFPQTLGQMGGPGIYFEAAAVIVTLILVGQVLEIRARHRTGAALRALQDLAPKTAAVIEGGEERSIPLEEVVAGMTLRVRPGEKVPADGVILEGRSLIDESMLTGESAPQARKDGDRVTAGTINGAGGFQMCAEQVGDDTILARIVQMVGEAQRSRAPIQALADRVAGWFAPAVVGVAVMTFIAWLWLGPEPRLAYALGNAVAVLIIACPCALGLATPMSVVVGIGRGAQAGILVKNAAAIQRLEKVTTVALDKTGTLTEGRPKLIEIAVAEGFHKSEALALAAAVEQASEHPLAAALISAARERGLAFGAARDFGSITGGGAVATVDGRAVVVGNQRLLEDRSIPVESLASQVEAWQKSGQTVVFVAVDGRAVGAFSVADPIKDSTREAIDALHGLGLKIVMLTGDHRHTAEAVGRTLGIDRIEAGIAPEDKYRRVEELRAKGEVVAMAGDGVNDAPALAAADVGIAMGTGTDVAIESAGITLVKGDLQGIARAVALSRALMRNIRQNLFFAFVYNLVGIPIAAGVLYPVFGWLLSPMLAGAAMSLSSLSVIGNALRLRKVELT